MENFIIVAKVKVKAATFKGLKVEAVETFKVRLVCQARNSLCKLALDPFNLINVFLETGIHDDRSIFKYSMNEWI